MASSSSPKEPAQLAPEHWVERYADMLYYYALQRVRHPERAEDLVQETFLAAWKNRTQFAGQSKEQTWLVSILRHKIVDYLRGEAVRRPAESEAQQKEACEGYFDRRHGWLNPPRAWTGDPVEHTQWQAFWEVFQQCLGRLPTVLAHTFTLREMEEQSSDQVCKELEINASNLWVRLHRARLLLRECLESRWFTERQESD